MSLLQGPRTRSKWRWWVIATSYKSAVKDEEWKQSPVNPLLRDFSGVSAYVPYPWNHTAEEWHLIQKLIQAKFSLSQEDYQCNSIVVALQYTWKLHFSEKITDVDLNTLSQQLEHVSQEKVFGRKLSLVQDLMRSQLDDTWMDSWKDLVWEEMSEPSVRKS